MSQPIRYVSLIRVSLLLVLGWSVPWIGTTPLRAQDVVTVTGEVVDLTCYLSKGSRGAHHRTCARMCAKKGLPIGLLTKSGEVLLIIEDHDNPESYEEIKKLAGQDAEVTGKAFSKGGLDSIMAMEARGM